eukprot:248701_1
MFSWNSEDSVGSFLTGFAVFWLTLLVISIAVLIFCLVDMVMDLIKTRTIKEPQPKRHIQLPETEILDEGYLEHLKELRFFQKSRPKYLEHLSKTSPSTSLSSIPEEEEPYLVLLV